MAGAAWAARVAEEAAIVGRVVLFRQARTEVERADQLALRDEWHDQRDAGLAQGPDRRRVELQAGEVDRTRGRLEVGEQRVRFGDVDRDRSRGCVRVGPDGRVGGRHRITGRPRVQ